jgi:hypothetical protein
MGRDLLAAQQATALNQEQLQQVGRAHRMW